MTCGYINKPEIIDEEPRPDEVVEPLHDRTGQEQHLLPLLDVDHLALDVECLVNILGKSHIGIIFEFWTE